MCSYGTIATEYKIKLWGNGYRITDQAMRQSV